MPAGMPWRKSPNPITALATQAAEKASQKVIPFQKLGEAITMMPLIKSVIAVTDAMAPIM